MKRRIEAVMLCGGFGSRISEITKKIPKPLIEIHERPIIWYVVSALLKNKVNKIIFPLGYRGDQIKKYIKASFQKESKNFLFINTGIKTEISDRIKKIRIYLKNYDNFILLNSDTIFNFNIKSFIDYHENNNFLITLSGIKMNTSWGSIIKDDKNLVKKFSVNSQISTYQLRNFEKFEAYRNTGLSIISSKCLDYIKTLNKKNFEVSLYNKYTKSNKVGVKIFNDFWYPIETYKDLTTIQSEKKLKNKIKFLRNKFKYY